MAVFSSCFSRNCIFNDDDKVIDQTFVKIIQVIKNRDKNGFKRLFSKQVSQTVNLEDQIDFLFGFIQGEIETWEGTGALTAPEGRNDDGSGRVWKVISKTYDIKTSKQKYHVAIQEVIKHSQKPELIGVSSFCIISENDWNSILNYWGDLGKEENFETLGIVVDFNR